MFYPRLSVLCLVVSLLLPFQARAGISSLGNPQLIVTPPTTPAGLIALTGCQDFSQIIDTNSGIEYILQNCAGTYQLHQMWPPLASELLYSGSTGQYVRGDGSLATFPTPGAWTFNHPSRALNSCFQASSTQDTNFTYSVDISSTLTLGGGTGLVTSYTNSGCTTGAQSLANGSVSSVALGGSSSIPLTGWLPAGTWAKITGTASGGGTAAIDAVQSEALKP